MRELNITTEKNCKKSCKTTTTRLLKEDISNYTLIQLIEKVVNLTENSKLSEKAIIKCRPYTKVLAQRLSLTEMQSLLLSVFINLCNDYNINTQDIAGHFQCSNISVMCYTSDIDTLVERKYIRKIKSDEHLKYKVHKEVVNSLSENTPFVLKSTTNLDIDGLFENFDKYFEEQDDDEITTDELCDKIVAIMEENAPLPFVGAVKKYLDISNSNTSYSLLIFIFMCHKLISDEDDDILLSQIEKIFDRKRCFRYIKHSMKECNHELLDKGLIEEKKSAELFNRDRYQLTKMVKQEMLSDFELEISESVNVDVKNIIKSETITVKALFYNEDESRQIEQLSSLLEEANFKSVQQRLIDSGMRKGFTSLFYGSPGTGKTESVYQIARQTGRDIIPINVSDIKSMWVGASEKNIKAVFDNYRKLLESCEKAPILLFNEADAVLGVRKEGAEQAVDKMENSIQNIILQEMETLEGIMIATTNLTKNLDKAFERRFLYKIELHKPSTQATQAIWKSMMSTLSDAEAHKLAENFSFSGGQIENIARKHAVDLIINGEQPIFETLQNYCQQEMIEKNTERRKIGF